MRDCVENIKTNDQIFTREGGSKDLVLDGKGRKKLDQNGFTYLGYFKMSTIGCSKVLREGFPMGGWKKVWIDNGGSRTSVKECNNLEGFGIRGQPNLDFRGGNRLVMV